MFNAPHVAGEGIGPSPIRLRALSLGAGVQSTTMALMAAHGEIGPMPDCAIFADTGWEPKAVYDHLSWLMSPNVLPFPVIPSRQAVFVTSSLRPATETVDPEERRRRSLCLADEPERSDLTAGAGEPARFSFSIGER